MSPTSYRAAPPRGDRVTVPERWRRVNPPSRKVGPDAERPAPRCKCYGFWVFEAGAGGAEGEPAADGGICGFSAVVGLSADGAVADGAGVLVDGDADGVVVDGVADAWPIRCDFVSLSRRPVTLMFSAF